MIEPTADNIDRLCLHPLDRPAGWLVTFRSANPGCCHQLYANGRLVDATDTPDQRSFELSATNASRELAILAVPPRQRWDNLTHLLPDNLRTPSWVYRPAVPRSTAHSPGEVLELRHDHATGTLDEHPSLYHACWPDTSMHWGWGLGGFGIGGFGVDGDLAPGFGLSPFGTGPLGFDAILFDLELAFANPGLHQIAMNIRSPEGALSTTVENSVAAQPPPSPPNDLSVESYDVEHESLTLFLTKD